MEKLAKIEKTLPSVKEIGNIVINYDGYDKPIDAIPIALGDGETYLLANIRADAGCSRLILQDLKGNTIKQLINFGYGNGEVTVDNDNIYIFTSDATNPMFYTFDKKTLELKYKQPLEIFSCIQGVCCNEKEIFTFDMNRAEVQRRDKHGNIISTTDTSQRFGRYRTVPCTEVFSTSEGFNFISLGEFGFDDKFRRECEEKFGKEIMESNRKMKNMAFDESSQTLFGASQNIIYVAVQNKIKGIMYFPDKSIMGLSVNPETNSLVISSCNWPESGKVDPFRNGGSLEILPISMIPNRIKSSEAFLIERNQNKKVVDLRHRIVGKSNGDIEKRYLEEGHGRFK